MEISSTFYLSIKIRFNNLRFYIHNKLPLWYLSLQTVWFCFVNGCESPSCYYISFDTDNIVIKTIRHYGVTEYGTWNVYFVRDCSSLVSFKFLIPFMINAKTTSDVWRCILTVVNKKKSYSINTCDRVFLFQNVVEWGNKRVISSMVFLIFGEVTSRIMLC